MDFLTEHIKRLKSSEEFYNEILRELQKGFCFHRDHYFKFVNTYLEIRKEEI